MILDSSRSLELVLGAAHATAALVWGAEYVDHSASGTGVPVPVDGTSNGTTEVTMVAAPGAGVGRQVLSVNVYNSDTVAQTVTVRVNNSSTMRTRHKATMQPGDVLTWSPGRGFAVLDASGNVRTIATPAGGGAGTGDGLGTPTHAGGSGVESWACANAGNMTALTTATLTLNRLYAMPLIAPRRGGRLDRLAIKVTTLASSSAARLGIYRAAGEGNIYPSARVLDAGTVDVSTTGVKALTISQALVAGAVYWLCVVSNGGPVIQGLAVGGVSPFLGVDPALGTAPRVGMYVAFTYAALPDPFPSSPTWLTAAPIPALYYRFDA
jgi:hypothetical protein